MKKENRIEDDLKKYRLKSISKEYKKDKIYSMTENYNVEYKTRKRWYFSFLVFALYVMVFVLFMANVYNIDYWKAFFEFANHYLFVGGVTLVVYLVFKRKK